MVAARFASQFAPRVRLYRNNVPQWHIAVDEAIELLATEGVISGCRAYIAAGGHSNSKPARTIGAGETLTTHADAAEASVIGVDDPYGTRLVAVVVLENNPTRPTTAPAEAVKAHVRENLAN